MKANFFRLGKSVRRYEDPIGVVGQDNGKSSLLGIKFSVITKLDCLL